MAHLFTFTSGQFTRAGERQNPINPIAGEGVLKWLTPRLDTGRFSAGDPDAEDWGWYTHVVSGPCTYLLGASGEWTDANEPTEWTVQLHKQRSLREKVTGANKLTPDDALSAAIEAVIRGNPEFVDVIVTRS